MRNILSIPILSVLFLLSAEQINAQTANEPNAEGRLRVPIDQNYTNPLGGGESEGLLGNICPKIHGNDALHFDYNYVGGVFSNARGGMRSKGAVSYLGLFSLGMTADTEKLGLWKNGTFYLSALSSSGQSITDHYVGDWQYLSVFDYGTPIQVSEYWYEHHFFSDFLFIRGGKMDAGTDFFYLNSTENFINSSGSCAPATGIPTAPNNAWGMLTAFQLTGNICFKFGMFDASGSANKFWMSQSGNIYTAYQLDYHYKLFNKLPGFAYVGTWYNDSAIECHHGRTVHSLHGGKSGYAVGWEQMIWKPRAKPCNPCGEISRPSEDDRGWTLFTNFCQPKTDRDDELRRFWAFGARWKGLLANRPNDVFGLALFKADFDSILVRNGTFTDGSETAYEIHYHAHLTENIALQPVFQYIVHPGGQYKNSFVPGLVFNVTF